MSPGERYSYELSYGKGFCAVNAGKAELFVDSTNHLGRTVFALNFTMKASSFVETFYHFDTRITSLVMPDARPLHYFKHAEEGRRIYDEEASFAYSDSGTCKVNSMRAVRGRPCQHGASSRESAVYDLVSVVFHARTLDIERLALDERVGVSVATGIHVEDQTLVYKGRESVEGLDGTNVTAHVFALVRIVPCLRNPSSERARFWFSTDAHRIPLRMDFDLKFGAVRAFARP